MKKGTGTHMKTYFFEQTQQFVLNQIESIDNTIAYANRQDWTRTEKIDYCERKIRNTRESVYGALIYSEVYLRAITETEYKGLTDVLDDVSFDRESKLWELID